MKTYIFANKRTISAAVGYMPKLVDKSFYVKTLNLWLHNIIKAHKAGLEAPSLTVVS